MKKILGKLLRNILPYRWYKLIANKPMLVPSYYRTLIMELEHGFDVSQKETPEKNLLLLRKYAHILDKGIQRRSAEPGHSLEYYQLLRRALASISLESKNDPSVLWAEHIADEYDRLQKGLPLSVPQNPPDNIPVSYEKFCELMKMRRSNRCFSNRQITAEILDKLKATVCWAASSCNKQPIELFCTTDTDLAQKCLKSCKGGTGFDGSIPSFWVFCADSRGYVWPSELYLPHIDVSLGAQNFFLAATTLGISGTILSWAQSDNIDKETLRALLNIPSEYIIVFCAVLGYAEYQYNTPIRKF